MRARVATASRARPQMEGCARKPFLRRRWVLRPNTSYAPAGQNTSDLAPVLPQHLMGSLCQLDLWSQGVRVPSVVTRDLDFRNNKNLQVGNRANAFKRGMSRARRRGDQGGLSSDRRTGTLQDPTSGALGILWLRLCNRDGSNFGLFVRKRH